MKMEEEQALMFPFVSKWLCQKSRRKVTNIFEQYLYFLMTLLPQGFLMQKPLPIPFVYLQGFISWKQVQWRQHKKVKTVEW